MGKEKEKGLIYYCVLFVEGGSSHVNYESFKDFLCFFKVNNMPNKHWSNSLGWEVVESMHDIVLQHTKKAMKQSPFFVHFVDEVTTIDSEPWIFIHEYAFNNC